MALTIHHLSIRTLGMDPNDPEGLKKYLGDRDVSALTGSGMGVSKAAVEWGLAGCLHAVANPVARRSGRCA
jgi:hypothetical protein